MGADMVMASLGFKADERFELDQDHARGAMAQARSAIEALDQSRLDAINGESCAEYEDLTHCRKQMLSDVANVEAAVANERRDVAFIPLGAGHPDAGLRRPILGRFTDRFGRVNLTAGGCTGDARRSLAKRTVTQFRSPTAIRVLTR